jgi:imidazolonepropionase-like amidohydrolase
MLHHFSATLMKILPAIAAIALGCGDNLCSLAPGKIADVIGMKADPLTTSINSANPAKSPS